MENKFNNSPIGVGQENEKRGERSDRNTSEMGLVKGENKMSVSPSGRENKMNVSPSDVGQEGEKRKGKLDRSLHKYSEADFRGLPREDQLRLANKHWMDSKGFDESGMFQFSYTHFSNICKDLGFEKGVLDVKKESRQRSGTVIFIERGKREEAEVKKITLSKRTIEKMDHLLSGLTNIEKSKVMDVILELALDERLLDKASGKFEVFYKQQGIQRIL